MYFLVSGNNFLIAERQFPQLAWHLKRRLAYMAPILRTRSQFLARDVIVTNHTCLRNVTQAL